MLLILGSVSLIAVPTRYLVTDTELVVQAGVWKDRFPLNEILRVRPSSSPISSPAMSLDRLAVEYRSGSQSRPTVYIAITRA